MTDEQAAWQRVVDLIPHQGECTFPDRDCECGAAREREAMANAILAIATSN